MFDVVIAGGGSAGAALAARLSEKQTRSVLLLEAGCAYAPDKYPEVLASSDRVGGDAAHDWGYQATATPIARQIHATRARVLGGSSAVNAAVALRPKPSDLDKWVKHGLPEWSFANTLNTFKKLENTDDGEDYFRGRHGPVPIRTRQTSELTPALAAFIEGAVECDYPRIEHFNGRDHEGVGPYSLNVANSVRQNTGICYLTAEVRKRPNLSILGQTEIDCVLLQDATATGVRAVDGQTYEGKLIILSAGTYGSAPILLRSGIGPAEHLAALGIPNKADLPVGVILKDHPFAYNVYSLKHGATSMQPTAGALVWTRSGEAHEGDLDLHISATHIFDPAASPTGGAIVLAVGLVQPDSVGSLKLRSRDPHAPPLIEYNFLREPRDQRRLLEGVSKSREISRSSAFGAVIDKELMPGSAIDGDTALLQYFRESLDTYHHPVSTAAMGTNSDGRSVVNVWGEVHGIDRLRVIDASIIPEIPSVPTNVTTIMVAEHIYEHSLAHSA